MKYAIDICSDCMYADAYGIDEILDPIDPEVTPLSRLDDDTLIGPVIDHECEGHFSKSPCDGCGTRLHGTRYCYEAIAPNPPEPSAAGRFIGAILVVTALLAVLGFAGWIEGLR